MQFVSLPNKIVDMTIPAKTLRLCSDIKYASARKSAGGLHKTQNNQHNTQNNVIQESMDESFTTWSDENWKEEGNVVADLRRKKKGESNNDGN
jgi:hypothetical protein